MTELGHFCAQEDACVLWHGSAPGVHGELVRRWQGAQRLAVASVTDPVGLRSPSP